MKYTYELTDTYCGETNYCWVRRGDIEAKNWTGAIRQFFKAEIKPGTPHKTAHFGDEVQIDFPRFNMRAFITTKED